MLDLAFAGPHMAQSGELSTYYLDTPDPVTLILAYPVHMLIIWR